MSIDTASQQRTNTQGRYVRFVAAVQERCRDSGRRAALRSGLRRLPKDAHRMHGALPWGLMPEQMGQTEERAYYTVAALIAAQPRPARDIEAGDTETGDEGSQEAPPGRVSNLGATFGQAVFTQAMKEGTAETRLHLLARQGADGIHRHLPAVVRHLRAERVDLDWARLLRDLIRWGQDRDQVAKEWLQAYYRTLARRSTDADGGNAGGEDATNISEPTDGE